MTNIVDGCRGTDCVWYETHRRAAASNRHLGAVCCRQAADGTMTDFPEQVFSDPDLNALVNAKMAAAEKILKERGLPYD